MASTKASSDPKAAATNAQPKAVNTQMVRLPRNIKGQNKSGAGDKGIYK